MGEDLKERFTMYLNVKGISYGQVARELGISKTVISQYVNGNYQGDIPKLETAIDGWFRDEKRRQKKIEIGFVPIKTTKRILNALALAQVEKQMGFIVGYAGVGKTFAIRQYQKNHNVIVIQGEPGLRENDLIRRIALECGVKGNSLSEVKENMISFLAEREGIIIVDEANYLRPSMLEVLRRVCHDQGKAAVVFVGVRELMNNIFLNSQDYQQLQRRIGIFLDLTNERLSYQEAVKMVNTITDQMKEQHIRLILQESKKNPGVFVMLLKRVLKSVEMRIEEITEEVIGECKNQILFTADIQRRKAV